jgi:hypothetical protein
MPSSSSYLLLTSAGHLLCWVSGRKVPTVTKKKNNNNNQGLLLPTKKG